MGSILARAYAIRSGGDIDGLILSAAGGDPGVLAKILLLVAKLEGRVRGGRARSTLLDTVTFGRYNNAFKPNRTKFDWLSRDQDQVDKYIADPWCGYISTTTFFADLFQMVTFINDKDNIAQVPTTLPIYLSPAPSTPSATTPKGWKMVASSTSGPASATSPVGSTRKRATRRSTRPTGSRSSPTSRTGSTPTPPHSADVRVCAAASEGRPPSFREESRDSHPFCG